jgi:Flp pilus assembly protein TadD
MREFVEALKINPSSDRAHLGLGWVYDEMDLCDKAIEEYQKAIKLDPKNEAAYNNLGWAYAKKGEFDAAIKSLKKAIRLDKDFALAYNNLGEVYLHKKMFIEASQNLERSISLGYKNPYTHIFLYLALLSRGEKEDAKREYKKIFTLFPDKASAHRAIGWVYHRYERYKDALRNIKGP